MRSSFARLSLCSLCRNAGGWAVRWVCKWMHYEWTAKSPTWPSTKAIIQSAGRIGLIVDVCAYIQASNGVWVLWEKKYNAANRGIRHGVNSYVWSGGSAYGKGGVKRKEGVGKGETNECRYVCLCMHACVHTTYACLYADAPKCIHRKDILPKKPIEAGVSFSPRV